jgi:hypothetical protein
MKSAKRKFKPREDQFIIEHAAAWTNHRIGRALNADAKTIQWRRAELKLPPQPYMRQGTTRPMGAIGIHHKDDYRPEGWSVNSGKSPCLKCENYPPQPEDEVGMKDVCAMRCKARVEWAEGAS